MLSMWSLAPSLVSFTPAATVPVKPAFFFLMIRRPPRSTLFPTRRSSDLHRAHAPAREHPVAHEVANHRLGLVVVDDADRKSTRLNSSHANISYAVFCLKKKKKKKKSTTLKKKKKKNRNTKNTQKKN